MHWTEAEYREYKARLGSLGPQTEAQRMRALQLPLGRGVKGLERPKRVNTSAPEWQEAQRLMRWVDEEGVKIHPQLQFFYAIPNGGFRHKALPSL